MQLDTSPEQVEHAIESLHPSERAFVHLLNCPAYQDNQRAVQDRLIGQEYVLQNY